METQINRIKKLLAKINQDKKHIEARVQRVELSVQSEKELSKVEAEKVLMLMTELRDLGFLIN